MGNDALVAIDKIIKTISNWVAQFSYFDCFEDSRVAKLIQNQRSVK